MNDPWKYLAFPAAALGGFLLAQTALVIFLQDATGLGEYVSEIVVVASAGLVSGFMVDEVIPAYIEKLEEKRNAGGMGGNVGGGNEDFDFE